MVVAVQATARFESDSKLISLENKNCVLPGENRNVSCIKVTYCLNYDGTSVPASIGLFKHFLGFFFNLIKNFFYRCLCYVNS